MKRQVKPGTNLAPVPVVMLSCGKEDNTNITTIAWTGIMNSEPPLVYVSIRPTRYSYEIIKENKEFVLNIPDKNLVWQTDFCGTKTGKQIDKFKEAKLSKEKAMRVSAPIIKECPINMECKLKQIQPLGSHDMFIGEIVATHVDEPFILEDGTIDYLNANLLTYAPPYYLIQNNKAGKRGICLT